MMRILLVLGLVATLTVAPAEAQAPQQLELTILHLNDFHSRVLPINRVDVLCSEREIADRQCVGGAPRLAARIRGLRAELQAQNRASLVLFGGDEFQGSLFYTHYKGEVEALVMNAVGYDAMALGNHEFDDGPQVLAPFVRAVRFPVLGANVDTSREPLLNGLIQPFTVVERSGRRIGIVAATTADTPILASPGPNVAFAAAEEAVRAAIGRLHQDGVRTIVVVTHLGLAVDQQLAQRVDGITAIVGGHSHTLLSNSIQGAEGSYPVVVRSPSGNSVPIVQAGVFGRYLGRLNLTIGPDGQALSWSGDTEVLGADLPEDPQLRAELDRLAGPLEAIRRRVVGELARDADQTRCRREECEVGNLVSDAILWRTRGQNVQIVLQNGGGLRAGLRGGPVTLGDVLTVLPFQNTIATFRMKGADIRAALESGLSMVDQNAGRFPQVAGLRYVWNPERPPGQRVASVDAQASDGSFAPLNDDAVYTVASNNFMRRGGDGYAVLRDRAIDPYDFGEPLEDAVAAFIAANAPTQVRLDGRISRAR